jgi:hypothetical protein
MSPERFEELGHRAVAIIYTALAIYTIAGIAHLVPLP